MLLEQYNLSSVGNVEKDSSRHTSKAFIYIHRVAIAVRPCLFSLKHKLTDDRRFEQSRDTTGHFRVKSHGLNEIYNLSPALTALSNHSSTDNVADLINTSYNLDSVTFQFQTNLMKISL